MIKRGGLIVSCQALADEPLHSPYIMGRMAVAAAKGGAKGIRANSVPDIQEIKKQVALPIIGIIKQDYPGSEVYITPTIKEVDALVKQDVAVIALDATQSRRPDKKGIKEFFYEIKQAYPNQKWMADCSTVEEMIQADALGFDYIATTLVGYTPQSKGVNIADNDFSLLREILHRLKHPIIAEGNIDSPEKAKEVLQLGCYSVVVGSSITRPQVITKRFVDAIKEV